MQTIVGNEFRPIAIDLIDPDPDQPRKNFSEAELRELGASIRQNGLLQPITIRPAGERFTIIAGERRYRAHRLIGAPDILARIIEPPSVADVRIKQIIENDQRQDVTPLEQANSYRDLMERTGWSAEELASKLGKLPFRIEERISLLRLEPEYRKLLAGANLTPTQAYEMSRLKPESQRVLFRAIKAGSCRSANDLRAAATALLEAEAQMGMAFGPAPEPPTKDDLRQAKTFESRVESLASMLRAGIDENEITAVRKVNPARATTLADILAAMQTDLRRLETALRTASIQADLLAMAAE